MATAYGPESYTHTMGDLNMDALGVKDAIGPHGYARAAPPPNPTFSFPARLDDDTPPANPTTPTFPRRTPRRPMSAVEPVTESYQLTAEPGDTKPMGRSALPSFSFNPGASLPPDPDGLPTEFLPSSPQLPRTIPSGPRVGHRRGGSEFVGGRIREGSSIAVLSGSPTKQELESGSASLAPPRRGHRRGLSSAMSTNDLSLLSPPLNDFSFKGSSAPNSPTNFEHMPTLPLVFPLTPKLDELEQEQQKEEDQGVTACFDAASPDPAELPKSLDAKPASKARVGFSDTLEFIPRPLSLVSTDTSSTVTVRPSHNVSESISSFVSASSPDHRGTSSPVLSRSSSRNNSDSRPSTAGAILDRIPQQEHGMNSSPRRRNSIPTLLDVAEANQNVVPPAPSPSKMSKRWTFFGLDSFSNHSQSPTKARPQSSSSGDSATRAVSGGSSSEHESESQTEVGDAAPQSTTSSSGKKKKTKRRKKVKGWAGSILPRKPKSQADKQSKYQVRPPTPPSSDVLPDNEELDDDKADAASDTVSPMNLVIPPRTNFATTSLKSDDVLSPMIDLDAALGPFNTPLPNNPEWDAAQRAAGNAGKRRLHSAQGMRGFSGPGMHYHRRAESAPDLPPFDAARAGIPRFGSSSTMADVFEEEEEEDATSSVQSRGRDSLDSSDDESGETTPPAIVQSDPVQEKSLAVRRHSSGLSDRESTGAESIRARRSKASLHDSPIIEEPTIRFHPNTFQSESRGSPHLSAKSPMSGVGPFEACPPQSLYAGGPAPSPHSTNFPPSVPRSPVSVDTQRLSTAPSSVQEENSFQSLLLGEPGPEVRLSVDYDVPSLTSSISATTRESCFVPQPRMSQPSLRQPRPLSVSSTAFGRRRSSLASLSRLISSSHGERSKLSAEVTFDPEAENKKSKGGATKRLGKFMQFWKSKDSTASAKRS